MHFKNYTLQIEKKCINEILPVFEFNPNDRCFRFPLLKSSMERLDGNPAVLQTYIFGTTTKNTEVPFNKTTVIVETTFKEPGRMPADLFGVDALQVISFEHSLKVNMLL